MVSSLHFVVVPCKPWLSTKNKKSPHESIKIHAGFVAFMMHGTRHCAPELAELNHYHTQGAEGKLETVENA